MQMETWYIRAEMFNLNALYDQILLRDYRFTKAHVGKSLSLIGWCRVSKRSEYNYNEITATCFVLRKLDTCIRWSDLELKYEQFGFYTLEIIWKIFELFTIMYEHVDELRSNPNLC